MTPAAPLRLSVEEFADSNPALNPDLLLEHARVALDRYHSTPAAMVLMEGAVQVPASVAFRAPNPRSEATLARERSVELGAVVFAGIVLHARRGVRLTRVMKAGDRVDYFAGDSEGEQRYIVEVSGTDEQAVQSVRAAKREQLLASRYRRPPFSKDGFVSVTRFAPAAVTAIDSVPAERG